MKKIALLSLFCLFTFWVVAQPETDKQKRNRFSGLNKIELIPGFQSQFSPFATGTQFTVDTTQLNPLMRSNHDGLKVYFGAKIPNATTINQLVLLACHSGTQGNSYTEVIEIRKKRRRSNDANNKYFKVTGSTVQAITKAQFEKLQHNYETSFPDHIVKGYFIGKHFIKKILEINNNKLAIKIGDKKNQYVTDAVTSTINFHYLVVGTTSPSFRPIQTTYFGHDVLQGVASRFGIDTDEIPEAKYTDFAFWLPPNNVQDGVTRAGGSKPCPPFGCQ